MEACSDNQRVYGVMWTAACPSSAGGAQGGKGLGLQDRPNGWGIEYTRFHRMNVVIYNIVWKVPDVEAGWEVTTVGCGVDGSGGSGVGSANKTHWD